MGRRSRRFTVRLCAAGAVLAGGWASYHRWQLRRGAVTSLPTPVMPSQSRAARLQRLASSDEGNPLDVLVVGGGATGLYAAVDAAQRGLRVAVVDADDFGAASTSTSPPLLPGAFPFVQRALRQRDVLWLRRAVEAVRALTVWSNVAPGIVDNRVSTLIPSSHLLELAEFIAAGIISDALGFLFGTFRPIGFVSGRTLTKELQGAEDDMRGGLVIQDATLDAAAASIALARTAETLGAVVLNYACVTSIADVDSMHKVVKTDAKFAVVVKDVSAPKDADKSVPQAITVYTRSIVNCSGSWADEVRQLLPNKSTETAPGVFGRHQVMSYLVVPRSAVLSCTRKEFNSVFGVKSMLASPTSYSFSSVMLLPWFDECMLIGPSVSPLQELPSRTFSSKPSTSPVTLTGTSASGSEIGDVSGLGGNPHESCRKHICRGLNASGIIIEEKRILSSLSCIVPVITTSQTAPWAADILFEGYHISAGKEHPYVVHVYGGSLCFARDIAEKALDRLLRDSGAFTEKETKSLRSCKTRQLALVGAETRDGNTDSASPILRLQKFLREDYAVRLLDVVARRTRVAYSSPAEALAALPAVADVMCRELNWSTERKRVELDLAKDFINSISVA